MTLRIVAFGILTLAAGLLAAEHPARALAQVANGPYVVDDASGVSGSCTVYGPSGDQVVFCSDLRPGNGVTVTDPGIGAATVSKDAPPPAPEPDAAPAPDAADTAVASSTDRDADNAPDDQEPGLGLDPTNPDTDADGVADGDEPNIYGTDPLNWDTDGDGASDGEELFGIFTDPLVWNDFGS
jgi:hypothetical protein